uniref:ASL1/B3gnt1 fusion protein n=1 Tax=Mus musculus TaxID=10090 RepID=C6EQJ7_MOUSE|nr:ASL1/B3gnt1 fusion protein [Mus musculus]
MSSTIIMRDAFKSRSRFSGLRLQEWATISNSVLPKDTFQN